MKFLALIYTEESEWDALPRRSARRDVRALHGGLGRGAREGAVVDGSELAPTSTATTVRVRDGETLVTDGPFAETKEALGGYYLFECESLDEALDLAARIPAAEHGAVEVRPVPRRRGGRAGARVRRRSWHEVRAAAQQRAGGPRALGADVRGGGADGARGGDPEVERALRGADGRRPLARRPGARRPGDAKTVRVRDGERLVTDGPYAETKEQIGGFFLIEAEDLDQAIAIAAKIPVAERASVEIRPRSSGSVRIETVDRVFREEWPRAVSLLTRVLGDLQLAEDAVQDAFTIALERWRARRPAGEPRRVDRHDRAQPRDRPDPPRAHARAQDASCWPGSRSCGRARRTT